MFYKVSLLFHGAGTSCSVLKHFFTVYVYLIIDVEPSRWIMLDFWFHEEVPVGLQPASSFQLEGEKRKRNLENTKMEQGKHEYASLRV